MSVNASVSQPGLRSFVSFLSISVLAALLFILTGSYGSFIDILLSAAIAGGCAWLIWMALRLVKMPNNSLLRMQHMLSGGCFTLLLLTNIHHPLIQDYFHLAAQGLGLDAELLQNPAAFAIGGLFGLILYFFNSDIERSEPQSIPLD